MSIENSNIEEKIAELEKRLLVQELYIETYRAYTASKLELENKQKEIILLVDDLSQKVKRLISILLGVFFVGVSLNFIIRLFLNFGIQREILLYVVVLLIMIFSLMIFIFLESKIAINIAASATAPFLAVILSFNQNQGTTFEELLAGIGSPLILLMCTYGLLVFGANILDWMSNRIAKKIRKEEIEKIQKEITLLKLIHQDVRPEIIKKFLYNPEFQDQMIELLQRFYDIFKKHGLIPEDDVNLTDNTSNS